MGWNLLEMTHYTGDDGLENFSRSDYTPLTGVETLSQAIGEASMGKPWSRIDGGDSPTGGVFVTESVGDGYWDLSDIEKDNIAVYVIAEDAVLSAGKEGMK